jgi:hypothetical protein
MLQEKGVLLRIYISENDKHQHKPLYEWILHEAQKQGMAGATILRALEGFGQSSQIHSAKILRLSLDLPIVIEIVDTPEKIENFLPTIDHAITHGLATTENVNIRFYRPKSHEK